MRAPFARGPRHVDAEELLVDVVLDSTIGFPLPRPRRPADDHRSELPSRFVLEMADQEVRVLDHAEETTVESWPRGAVDAHIHWMDEDEIQLDLRWPRGTRGGRIVAATTPEAREVADLLAQDSRVARGVDRESDASLRRLVAETLSEQLQVERHQAVSGMAMLLSAGERPLLVASAWRGLSDGIVLLTDRTLRWWSGGRKSPLVLPREEIRSARCETLDDTVELVFERAEGRRLRVDDVQPPEQAAAIAEALTAPPQPPAALDELLAKEPDGSVSSLVPKQLHRLRGLLAEDERPYIVAGAVRGSTVGALVITDRRLLWAAKKGEPISIERGRIEEARTSRRFGVTRLDLTLTEGAIEGFDAIEPAERTAGIIGALGL